MPTALRLGPYRFYFYSYDCGEPRHMHVDCENKSAKFWLDPDADDLFDYQIETHPLFIERVRRARKEYLAGKSERLEDIRDKLLSAPDPE